MIGTVYDYYLTTYASKPLTRSDTHKKSELRNIYNNIVKISKSSPLYKVDVSANVQKYAIDLKENARSLMNDIDNLVYDSFSPNHSKYTSDNEEAVTINTLNQRNDTRSDNSSESSPFGSTLSEAASPVNNDSYSIEVKHLATPQVNTGYYLRDDTLELSHGEHTFEVAIDDNVYEFQFKVNEEDTNKSVIEKLSRLINRSGIGLGSNILKIGNTSALEISSKSTGTTSNTDIFSILNSSSDTADDVVDKLGIATVSSHPSDAQFTLNGIDKTSSTNRFTINRSIEVTLNRTTPEGEAVNITKRDDLDSMLDSVNNLIDGYNRIIELSNNKADNSNDASHLNYELKRTASAYKNDLESIGLTMNDDGSLKLDTALFLQSASEDTIEHSLGKLADFKNSLSLKTHDISINPMKYVNKTMISYPHPIKSKNFANPYVTSIYTGMMYNGYI